MLRHSIAAALAIWLSLGAAAQIKPEPMLGPGAPGPVRYDGHKVVRVTVSNAQEFLAVTSLADSVWTHSPGLGGLDVQVAPGKMAALADLGLPMTVLVEDLQAVVEAERAEIERRRALRDLTWFQNYKTLAEINAYLGTLAAANPALVSSFTVGNSLQGRAVNGIRITGPDLPGNPKSSRPQLIFNGCQHAREWISPMTVMFIADQLISGYATDARIRDVLDHAEVMVVPVVNPDGYEYTWTTERLWRKNRRNNGDGSFGVDPNRNWGYQWGGEGASTSPGSETFRGTSAFSEPETNNLRNFIVANTRLRAHIDFHSYGQLILSPWGYTSALPPDAGIFDQLNADIQGAIQSVHGMTYDAGPTYTTIYPASGISSDWTYGAGSTPRKILGWGIELRGSSFVLPADQIIPTGEENLAGILTLAESVAFPVKFTFPDGLPAGLPAGTTPTVRVSVTASPGNSLAAGSAKVYTRPLGGGAFVASTMTALGGSLYQASLPAGSCGESLEYYFEAQTTTAQTGRSPASAPDALYGAPFSDSVVTYSDACEASAGWTVGAPGDTATSGIWGLMAPQATAAQPGSDHSPSGTMCWVTDGRASGGVGTYDVDGGATTLTSPAFSALGPERFVVSGVTVSYWRWYSNNQGSNPNTNTMPVSISNDNGATWVSLETAGDNAGAWVNRAFNVPDFVAPTSTMRLRFVARDLTGAIVEAAVDDVALTISGCPCPPVDFNCDGFVDGIDSDLFNAAFEAGDPSADFNGDGFVDGIDYDEFMNAFEGG